MENKELLYAFQVYFSYVIKYQWENLKSFSKDSINKIKESGIELVPLEDIVLISDYKKYPRQRVEGAICTYKQKTYVLFMATNSTLDWVTNLFFFIKKVPYNNTNRKVKVHSGYINRYQLNSVRTKILLELANRKYSNKVIVLGYSMGGGLAPICAVDIAYNFPDKEVTCFAFAGPKVGNKAFVNSVDKRCKASHYSYGNDPVVKVPPKLFGFVNLKNEFHYGEKQKWWKINLKHHLPDNMYFSILKEE